MPAVEAFETQLGELRRVRRFIREACKGLSGDWISRLQVIVDEAFTNVISHGEARESIYISLSLEGDRVLIEIWDQGHPFDPESMPLPDLSEGRENGMGLVILRELADEVFYAPKEGVGGWNRLQMSVGRRDGSIP